MAFIGPCLVSSNGRNRWVVLQGHRMAPLLKQKNPRKVIAQTYDLSSAWLIASSRSLTRACQLTSWLEETKRIADELAACQHMPTRNEPSSCSLDFTWFHNNLCKAEPYAAIWSRIVYQLQAIRGKLVRWLWQNQSWWVDAACRCCGCWWWLWRWQPPDQGHIGREGDWAPAQQDMAGGTKWLL